MEVGLVFRRYLSLRDLRATVLSLNASIPVDCTHLVSSSNYVSSAASNTAYLVR